MFRTTGKRTAPGMAIICIVLLLAACGPAKKTGNGTTEVAAKDPHNPCQQLTKDDIKEVLHEELDKYGLNADGTQMYEDTKTGKKHWICIHATSSNQVTKQVQITTELFPHSDGANEDYNSAYQQWVNLSDVGPAPVEHFGIGDNAFSKIDGDQGMIEFISGTYVVNIVVQKIPTDDMLAALVQLAERAAARVDKL